MPRESRLFPVPHLVVALVLLAAPIVRGQAVGDPLPGTDRLTMQGDIASELIDGADRFLLKELESSIEARAGHWRVDFGSSAAFEASIEPNRARLAHILGLRDSRPATPSMEWVATTDEPALVGESDRLRIFAVRWPAFADVHGEGLLLVPKSEPLIGDVVVIPDADVLPEMLAGLVEGVPPESQTARRLAETGRRVLVPMLIDRTLEPRGGRAKLTSREYLYRSAFEMGRHLIGYELQKILAGVDWFVRERGESQRPIAVAGWGEGGMLALYAAALDTRIESVLVSGYFESRQGIWNQPIDRNVFGLLEQFGDAELALMLAERRLVIEACRGPERTFPSEGGAPAELRTARRDDVKAEFERARRLAAGRPTPPRWSLVVSGDGTGPFGSDAALAAFLGTTDGPSNPPPSPNPNPSPRHLRRTFDPVARHAAQMREIDRHSQELLVKSPYVRQEFMKRADTSSAEAYAKSIESYRAFFRNEVIGHFDRERPPARPRTRKAYEGEKWIGFEVVLDVFPDLIAYGVLIVPKGIGVGERRPVVVCQHGLEGRPQDVIQGDHPAYHDFATKLAERGFITFAPQNLYIFKDRFRTLQRKANPIKKTLFSLIVPQHQRIVDWLKGLPNVDPERIAFYGLSYGGKSAMRIPPLVTDYCLSICSADFNEWVWKNASTIAPQSYIWTGEYEIFEFDLGSTFNYAEMAALIAPRPFMVERGHFDGVAPDETVGYEFAKVRFLYQGRLKLKDRCEIEWFDGPHTINGQGTFAFLHKHLRWPAP
ncbi:MAG: hypothetical protein FJ297_09755 [Planctomycetes bacterium]|nr:hypothetical protein [Planctomycetota bacterium]